MSTLLDRKRIVRAWNRLAVLPALCLVLTAASLFAMGSSGKQPAESPGAATAPPKGGTGPGIGEVIRDPERFSGLEIVLGGAFRGWKGSCPESGMMTRSDWIVEDETGCIYVTGLAPQNLSSAEPHGERIMVQGTVIAGPGKKPVLKAARVTVMPKLPDDSRR